MRQALSLVIFNIPLLLCSVLSNEKRSTAEALLIYTESRSWRRCSMNNNEAETWSHHLSFSFLFSVLLSSSSLLLYWWHHLLVASNLLKQKQNWPQGLHALDIHVYFINSYIYTIYLILNKLIKPETLLGYYI